MTSRISFSKLTWDEFGKLAWLTAIQFLGFGLLIPVRVLIMMAAHMNDVKTLNWEPDFQQILCNQIGLGRYENIMAILAAGIFCAFCVFGYLYSSVKLDFLHSLPIRRERLFGIKYLAGVLTFVTAYGISQVLALLVGAGYGAVTARVVYEQFAATVQGILFFLVSFSGTLIAVMLTGKLITSVFAVIVMIGYLPMMIVLTEAYMAKFLPNLYHSGEQLTGDWLLYTSPWSFCMEIAAEGPMSSEVLTGSGTMPGMAQFCQLVALAAGCTVIALVLYRVRRTEASGSALAFGKTEGPVKILLAVPGALLAAMLAFHYTESLAAALLVIAVAGTLFCMIMEFIYRWDIQQILKKKRHISVTLALGIVVFVLFYVDVSGRNLYLPAKEDIAAMSVADTYMTQNRGLGGTDFSINDGRDSLTGLETEQIDRLYELAQNGIANTDEGIYSQSARFVYMKFRLKNGKEIYRNYWVDRDLFIEVMDAVIEDEKYRELYFPILGWAQADTVKLDGYCWLSETIVTGFVDQKDAEYVNTSIDILSHQVWDVVQAYQKDLRNITFREYEGQAGSIGFHLLDVPYQYMGSYNIGEVFEETINVLSEIWPG